MSDEKCEYIIKQAENLAADLENGTSPGIEVCQAHETLAKGIATSLRMLIPLYKAEKNGSGKAGLEKFISGTPLTFIAGWIPTAILIFLFLVGKGKGWW